MKVVITLLAVSAILVIVFSTTPAAFASSGWGMEDPQLCVNGQLLTVIPADPADVFVAVPKSAVVSYDMADCRGNPSWGVVPPDNVTYQGNSKLKVSAKTADGTSVVFSWSGQTVTDVADDGVASVSFSAK